MEPNVVRQMSERDLLNIRTKVEESISFLNEMKHKLRNQPHVFGDFLFMMTEFTTHRLHYNDMLEQAAVLFRGQPELLAGFNTFLDPADRIVLPNETAPDSSTSPTTALSNSPSGSPNTMQTTE